MDPTNYSAMLPRLDFSGLMQGIQLAGQKKQIAAQQERYTAQTALGRAEFNAEQAEKRAYTASVENLIRRPTNQGWAEHELRFPKQVEASRAAWGAYEAGRQQDNMSFMMQMHSLITAGKVPAAIELAEKRKAGLENARTQRPGAATAFNEGGEVADPINTDQTDAILSMLKSGNPRQIDAARGLAFYGIGVAAGPDKFASIINSVGGDASYTLSPGSRRYDRDGKLVAEAPFEPDRFTLGPGETRYESGGEAGPVSRGAQIAAAGPMFDRMVQAESGGRQFVSGGRPLISPKGAVGAAQVMPNTGPEAAKLAGVAWDRDRFHKDRDYNVQLGRAYFQKQMDDFGNPAQAAAAYNAGPGRTRYAIRRGGENWLSFMPRETQDYVARVVPGAGDSQASGGARVTARGAEKPTEPRAQRMTPEEVRAEGLDPAVVYHRNKDGVPTPVGGQPRKPAGDQAYSQSALDAFDRAINTANRLKTHDGLSASVGAKGVTGGLLGGWVMPGTDAADFNAELDAMKAQVFLPMVQSMKGMGALSNAEGEKLTAAIGALNPSMSEKGFTASLDRIITDLRTYRKRAEGKGRATASPARRSTAPAAGQRLSPAEAAKLPPGTRFIGQDGRARVRR